MFYPVGSATVAHATDDVVEGLSPVEAGRLLRALVAGDQHWLVVMAHGRIPAVAVALDNLAPDGRRSSAGGEVFSLNVAFSRGDPHAVAVIVLPEATVSHRDLLAALAASCEALSRFAERYPRVFLAPDADLTAERLGEVFIGLLESAATPEN